MHVLARSFQEVSVAASIQTYNIIIAIGEVIILY